MSRTAAEGNLKKLVYFLLGLAAVLFVASWYPQFSQGYEVQNDGRLACNDAIRIAKSPAPDPAQIAEYQRKFMAASLRAGVHLKPDDFVFDVTHSKADRLSKCKVTVHYPVDVEVAWVGAILGLEPYHFEKTISFVQEVNDDY